MDIIGYAHSTIVTYTSAISYTHKVAGLPDPSSFHLVQKLLDVIARKPRAKLPRLPINLSLLKQLIHTINKLYTGYNKAMFQAVFSLAFHLCLRIGELSVSNSVIKNVIYLNQLTIAKKEGVPYKLVVHFQHFKHKRSKDTVTRAVSSTTDECCPVTLVLKYLRFRGSKPGPVFLTPKGSPLRSSTVSKALATCLECLGLDHRKYGTHSLRIGGATQAAKCGASDAELRLLGRWRSNAFLTYIRPQEFSYSLRP